MRERTWGAALAALLVVGGCGSSDSTSKNSTSANGTVAGGTATSSPSAPDSGG